MSRRSPMGPTPRGCGLRAQANQRPETRGTVLVRRGRVGGLTSTTVTAYDPEFEAMAREFRRQMADEQEELEAIEREAEIERTDLPLALLESQWRGDQLRVVCGDRTFLGQVSHVGDNLVTLESDTGTVVNICTTAISGIAVTEVGRGGGFPRMGKDPVRFVARLRELAGQPGMILEFGALGTEQTMFGRLAEVRADHILVITRDGTQWMLPATTIAYCVRVPVGR